MKITHAGLKWFRSIVGLEFEFSDRRGIVFLTGQNDDEPALGANGAGKTSLWEGIYWILYGRTSTGLKGPELITWGADKKQIIGGYINVNGKQLARTWGPKNTLTIDEEDKTQEEIDQFIGLNAEQFLFSNYHAQHTPSFLDIGAQAKTDLIASVLNLDKWLDLSRSTQAKLDTCNADIEALNKELYRNDGAQAALEASDYEFDELEWQRTRAAKVLEMQASLLENKDAAKRAAQDLEDLRDGTLNKHADRIEEIDKVLEKYQKEQRNLNLAAGDCRARMRANAKDLEETDRGECPTCKQAWPKHLRSLADKLKVTRSDLGEEMEEIGDKLIILERKINVATKELDDISTKAKARLELVNKAKVTLERRHEAVANLVDSIAAARDEVSPYASRIKARDAQMRALKDKGVSLYDEWCLLTAHAERLAYWVKGFKDIRLFLVAEAMTQLEVEVNSALTQLGLHDWSIKFSPDADTKAGTIKRGFTVHVTSRDNTRFVPWAVWSGGEAQRLRIACTMGLSNLISSYLGVDQFIEVWDEPSNGMSKEGIADMLQAFERRAQIDGKQIWVVDHRALESGAFIETVVATKRFGSTTLERIDHGQGE